MTVSSQFEVRINSFKKSVSELEADNIIASKVVSALLAAEEAAFRDYKQSDKYHYELIQEQERTNQVRQKKHVIRKNSSTGEWEIVERASIK